jgi:hypothetical protein
MHNRDLLRNKTLLDLPKVNSAIGQSIFKYAGAKDSLPLNIREIISFSKFKRTVYTHLLELDNIKVSYVFVVYRNIVYMFVLYCI